jgi:hypothetical protein
VSVADDDPVCPECGGPIGMTSTYCMHCSADLTDLRERRENGSDRQRDGTTTAVGGSRPGTRAQSVGGPIGGLVGSIPSPRTAVRALRSVGSVPRGQLFGEDPIMNAVVVILGLFVGFTAWLVTYLLIVPPVPGTVGLVVAAGAGIVAGFATASYVPV